MSRRILATGTRRRAAEALAAGQSIRAAARHAACSESAVRLWIADEECVNVRRAMELGQASVAMSRAATTARGAEKVALIKRATDLAERAAVCAVLVTD